MHKESFVMGIAGVLLGLLGGWIIGAQQAPGSPASPAPVAQSTQATPQPGQSGGTPPALDENRAAQLKSQAEREAGNAEVRAQLGNLYFDGERFDEAARWYTAALQINPKNVNVSTDLGIAYYYTNQPDRALEQFDQSLTLDPAHSKTLLNIGVVRAWGKQDLEGAAKAWQRVIDVAPNSEEARRAKQGLEGIRAAHPEAGSGGSSAKPDGSSN
ncbi:MAG TPA: tetratricopeptide repeat protein [Vicinamibacterales bacterium]|nr:tetratricopeptide repeat protein [Vicinamibacterales bacterium]